MTLNAVIRCDGNDCRHNESPFVDPTRRARPLKRYHDGSPDSGKIHGIFDLSSNTYFLIQSDIAPILGEDFYGNNDGIIDDLVPAKSWNVLDSISLHPDVFTARAAYGKIVFVDGTAARNPISTAPGTPIVYGPGSGYAARIGDSTGHTAADWVVGTVRDMASPTATVVATRSRTPSSQTISRSARS